jgi:hypothetical protein
MKPAYGSMELSLTLVRISVTAFVEDDQHVMRPSKASAVSCGCDRTMLSEESSFEASSGRDDAAVLAGRLPASQATRRETHLLNTSTLNGVKVSHTFYSAPT